MKRGSYRSYYSDPRNAKPAPKWMVAVMAIFLIGLLALIIYQSARLETTDWPEIVSVEAADDYPVSLKDAEFYCEDYEDIYDLYFSDVAYKFRVTLSDGQQYVIPLGLFGMSDIDLYSGRLEIDAVTSLSKCKDKIEKGESTADVSVQVRLIQHKSAFVSRTVTVDSFDTVIEKDLVPCIVESVVHLSDKPAEIYSFNNLDDISGEKFEITYGDGTKKVVTATCERDEVGFFKNYLDGYPVSLIYSDYTDTEIYFLDSRTPLEIDIKRNDFERIELEYCTFDEVGELRKVDYVITKTDGTSLKRSSEDLHYFDGSEKYLIDCVEGQYIYLAVKNKYGSPFSDMKKEVTIEWENYFTDNILTHTATFELPESDCECMCHNNNSVVKWLYNVDRFASKIFSVNEVCRCGINHY